jgi:predicted transcriptional regulator of viral defense system
MDSIHFEVTKRIKAKGQGSIILPSDFRAIGKVDAVKTAMSRLEKQKILVRLAQGIYVYPKYDPELGMLTPSIEEIAKAMARRDRAKLIPSGVQAMHLLGFTTQVPMKIVYLTDGSPRNVRVGKQTVSFKRASPRQMAMKGKYSALVVQGIHELGKDNITSTVKNLAKKALSHEKSQIIQHDLQLAPEWVAKILRELTLSQEEIKYGLVEPNR